MRISAVSISFVFVSSAPLASPPSTSLLLLAVSWWWRWRRGWRLMMMIIVKIRVVVVVVVVVVVSSTLFYTAHSSQVIQQQVQQAKSRQSAFDRPVLTTGTRLFKAYILMLQGFDRNRRPRESRRWDSHVIQGFSITDQLNIRGQGIN